MREVILEFVNDTAKSDFFENCIDSDEMVSSRAHDFVLDNQNQEQEEQTTMEVPTITNRLEDIMKKNESILINGSTEAQTHMEVVETNYEASTVSDSKFFTLKTIRVNWEESKKAFLHVFVNSTYVKRLEQEKAANRCLHIMFSSISHEFRTPINAFSNALTLLELNCDKLSKLK